MHQVRARRHLVGQRGAWCWRGRSSHAVKAWWIKGRAHRSQQRLGRVAQGWALVATGSQHLPDLTSCLHRGAGRMLPPGHVMIHNCSCQPCPAAEWQWRTPRSCADAGKPWKATRSCYWEDNLIHFPGSKVIFKKPTELTYKYILVVKYPNVTEVVRVKTVYPLPSHSLSRTDSIWYTSFQTSPLHIYTYIMSFLWARHWSKGFQES